MMLKTDRYNIDWFRSRFILALLRETPVTKSTGFHELIVNVSHYDMPLLCQLQECLVFSIYCPALSKQTVYNAADVSP